MITICDLATTYPTEFNNVTGDVSIAAGLTSSSSMKGGTVRIAAGEGSSDQLTDGGDGELHVRLFF